MNAFTGRCLNYLLHFLAFLIIFFAIAITAGRAVVPMIRHERSYFEAWASKALKAPVSIGTISGGWEGFDPALTFHHVIVKKPLSDHTVIRIKQLSVAIDLWDSFLQWKLLPGQLTVVGTHVEVNEAQNGHFQISGVKRSSLKFANQKSSAKFNDVLWWLLTQTDITLKDVNIIWKGEKGLYIPLKNLQLQLKNDGDFHQIFGYATLDQKKKTAFRFNLDFEAKKIPSKHFSGDLYFQAMHFSLKQWLHIPQLQRYLKYWHVVSGDGGFRVWANWDDGVLGQVTSSVNFKNLYVGSHCPIVVKRFEGNFFWNHYKNGWGLRADKIGVNINGTPWRETRLGFRYTKLHQYFLHLDYLRLNNLSCLLTKLHAWPKQWLVWFQRIRPVGNFSNIAVVVKGEHQREFSLYTQFNRLGFSSVGKLPGAQGLNGSVYVAPGKGLLYLQSKKLIIDSSRTFAHPVALNRFLCAASWNKTPVSTVLSVQKFQLGDSHLALNTKFQCLFPKKGSPRIKLVGNFALDSLRTLKNYLPAKLMHRKLRTWLSQAFLQGVIKQGEIVVNGPLDRFPFPHDAGHFEVLAKVHNVSLNYKPGWPVMTGMSGDVTFNDQGLLMKIKKGVIAGNHMKNMSGQIPDIKHPILTVKGVSQTNLAQALFYLKNTPLGFAKSLGDLKASGPMHLALTLKIPLHHPHGHLQTMGHIKLLGAKLAMPKWDIALKNLNGGLSFQDKRFYSKGIYANVYGHPAVMSVTTTRGGGVSLVHVSLRGQASVAQLKKKYPLPFFNYLQGSTSFLTQISLSDNVNLKRHSLSFFSNLQGISTLGLPQPFQKTARQIRPFHFEVDFHSQQHVRMHTRYAHLCSAALVFSQRHGHLGFYSGELHVGSGSAAYQQKPGLIVTGKLPNMVFAEWQSLFAHKGSASLNFPLRAIELQIGHLSAMNMEWNNLYLKILPQPYAWLLNVQSKSLAGLITIPKEKHGLWRLSLQHWYLKKFASLGTSHLKPAAIPPLDVHIADFHYGAHKLGSVDLVSRPTNKGMLIEKADVKTPTYTFHAAGKWTQLPEHTRTNLSGSFTSTDLGSALANWGVTSKIVKGKGSANFTLSWPRAPYKFKAANLNGEVRLAFNDGRIIGFNKKTESELGLGRLLNILSVQSVMRRITGNFSDITAKGLEFYRLKGDFYLHDGNVLTHDAVLNGPVAKVEVQGRIGFAKEDMDLTVGVEPYVTSSLPLVVGLAGGPVAGAVAWFVNKLASPAIGRAAGSVYTVKGPWIAPMIIKHEKPTPYR